MASLKIADFLMLQQVVRIVTTATHSYHRSLKGQIKFYRPIQFYSVIFAQGCYKPYYNSIHLGLLFSDCFISTFIP
jgi:hypothetical protein